MEYKTKCGCIIVESPPNFGIEYCPKHKAAPDMYEALKEAREAINNEWLYQTGQFCRPQSNYPPQGSVHGSLPDAGVLIDKALAKVDGGK